MRRGLSLLFVLALAVSLFGAGSFALADDNLSGKWAGSWSGSGKSGPMHGTITQSGDSVNGPCVMENTAKGTLEGRLSGNASGGSFTATIVVTNVQGLTIEIDGTYQGDTINGDFSGLGDGTFTLNKQ